MRVVFSGNLARFLCIVTYLTPPLRCVYTYMRYDNLRRKETAPASDADDRALTVSAFTDNAGSLLADKDTWLAFFIVLIILGVILLLLIAILFKRLRIAIEVIEEASK